MCEESVNDIEIRQTRAFKKAFNRLSEKQKDLVDDEIEIIIKNPDIGVRKKNDLSHMWVHKFKLNNSEVLLGYSRDNDILVITLMNIGPHENFYRDATKRRTADLKVIKTKTIKQK